VSAAYLLDTVILIDHLRGVAQATRWLAARRVEQLAISVITRAEVLAGTTLTDEEAVKLLLDHYECYTIDKKIADLAASLRKQERLKLPDALQAALALAHGIKLVTRNTKDFNPKTHPFVMVPYVI
jgi:predicted nucleic acid-binding protein